MSGEVGTQLSSVCRKRSLVSWCRPGTRLLTISAQLTAFPAARPEPENTTCLVLPPSKRPSASPSRFRILLPSRTRISRVSGGSWGIGDEAGSSTEPALRYCSILPSRRWWVSLWICTRSPVDARPSRSSLLDGGGWPRPELGAVAAAAAAATAARQAGSLQEAAEARGVGRGWVPSRDPQGCGRPEGGRAGRREDDAGGGRRAPVAVARSCSPPPHQQSCRRPAAAAPGKGTRF